MSNRKLLRNFCSAIVLCCLTINTSAADAQASDDLWRMPVDVQRTTETFAFDPIVLAGPFQLNATITLEKLDGTAASVFLGDKFNFGFDSRAGQFFVEGGLLGKTRSLSKTDGVIAAGKPFKFSVKRQAADLLTIEIDGKEIYRSNVLRGDVGQIKFRPRRNVMTVSQATLSGSLRQVPEGLDQIQSVVPVLNDGSQQKMSTFTLTNRKPMTLTQIVVSHAGTTSLDDVQQMVITRLTKPRSGNDASTWMAQASALQHETSTIGCDLQLEPGTHEFSIQYAIRPTARLANRVAAVVQSVSFSDQTKWSNSKTIAPLRLARSIHKQGQFDCHTFRIPAIARTKAGTLLAVYDMRYNSRKDLQEHMDIGLSRSTDGGQTWSRPIPIMDMGEFGGLPQKENGCSDPGILVDENTGEIFVSACWTHGKPGTHQWSGKGSGPGFGINQTTQFMMVNSTDDGVTWTKPKNLTKQLKEESWWLFAPAPTVGLTLGDGTLVMASQGRNDTGVPFSNIMFSKDHGKTWTVSTPARMNCSECTVAELSDRSLMLNIRDNRNRKEKAGTNGRAVSITSDFGKTWTVHSSDHKSLPAPVCNASLLRHIQSDGKPILLFSNPRTTSTRTKMTIQASSDEGLTWPAKHHVLLDEKGGAYSGLVMVDDDTVGILYESSAADFIFQHIPLSELIR